MIQFTKRETTTQPFNKLKKKYKKFEGFEPNNFLEKSEKFSNKYFGADI